MYLIFNKNKWAALILFLLLFSFCSLRCKSQVKNTSGKSNYGILKSSKTNIKLTRIEPGTFLMGSAESEFQSDDNEHPRHKVTLTNAFFMGVYEVTQDEFTEVMGFNPSTQKGNGKLPVETLSWFDAVTFCNAISNKEGFDSCYTITNIKKEGEHIIDANVVWKVDANGYRLPTEAEWEFACRAGTTTPFPFGDHIGTGKANYDGNVSYLDKDGSEHLLSETKGIYRKMKLPVDSLSANNWGLYNIVGNVFEWVWDYYDKYPKDEQTNPTGPISGVSRVRRSGAFGSPGYHMRSALRHDVPPGFFLFHQGLRIAKNAKQ